MVNETPKSGTRQYRKRRRADQERQTRQRIVEAAVKLHGTVGPAETTVSGVAREAGVQRATVYRHFPDEESLFAACSAHYWSQYPPPDPASWASVEDHGERLRAALGEMYRWFGVTEEMLDRTGRDAEKVPTMAAAVAGFRGYIEQVAASLIEGWPELDRVARHRLEATAGHAVTFTTWQSLVCDQGLVVPEAVELMATLIESAGRISPDRPGTRARAATA